MFVIWNKNKKLPKEAHKKLVVRMNEYKLQPVSDTKKKFYTSYDGMNTSVQSQELYEVLNPYYSNLVKDIIDDVGLRHRIEYNFKWWVQMYRSDTTTHGAHHHFYQQSTILSWVHFIQSPRQRCFYFLNSNDEKIYPQQKSGDIIVFPSWAVHGVDTVKRRNFNRIIVAGNIGAIWTS